MKYDEWTKQYRTTCTDGTTATERYDSWTDQYRTTVERPHGKQQQCVRKYDSWTNTWRTTCD